MSKRKPAPGLYRRVKNNMRPDEMFFGDHIEQYIQEAERVACKVLMEADIDLDAITLEQIAMISRAEYSDEVGQALDMFEHCITARDSLCEDLSRNAFRHGIQLAQAVERFNANRAWLKTVNARIQSDNNLKKEKVVTDQQLLDVVNDPKYQTREKQAAKLGITARQITRRWNKLSKL